MKSKKPIPQKPEEQAEEWDLSQGMGILPPDISLTQNIGCVGNKKEKEVINKQRNVVLSEIEYSFLDQYHAKSKPIFKPLFVW
jgi:hypothetical protein